MHFANCQLQLLQNNQIDYLPILPRLSVYNYVETEQKKKIFEKFAFLKWRLSQDKVQILSF